VSEHSPKNQIQSGAERPHSRTWRRHEAPASAQVRPARRDNRFVIFAGTVLLRFREVLEIARFAPHLPHIQ
jgi:hypothetical protein